MDTSNKIINTDQEKKVVAYIFWILLFGAFISYIIFTSRTNVPEITLGDTSEIVFRVEGSVVLENVGQANREGHTPTTFQGQGTGLFIGDNLHGQFPEGAGLQTFVQFDLSVLPGDFKFATVELFSSFGREDGNPINDLGEIIVDVVSYDTFSSSVWNTERTNEACVLVREENESFSCEIGEQIRSALTNGDGTIAFRIRFVEDSDFDGARDLLSFFHGNPNLDQPGLFQLIFSNTNPEQKEQYTIPIVLHRILSAGTLSTDRSQENVSERFDFTADLWKNAGISYDVEIVDTIFSEEQIQRVLAGDFDPAREIADSDPDKFHGFFFKELTRVNGIAFTANAFAVADRTSVRDYRTVAHEIGHLLDLPHTERSVGWLMYQGSDGHLLSEGEIDTARTAWRRIFGE